MATTTSKVATAEDVIALVGAAADGSPMESTMQQLLLQVQAQQAEALAAAAVAAASSSASGSAPAHADASDAHHQALLAASEAMESAMKQQTMAAMGHDVAQPMEVIPVTGGVGSDAVDQSADGKPAAAAVATSAAAGSSEGETAAVKRKSIPLSMKKEAIEWIMGPGKGIPSRAEKHFSALNWEVSASSFRKWWKNRDKILGDSSSKKRISGGGRKPYLEDAEEKLLVVVIQERAKKDRVTRKWIAKTAQHMFQRSNMSFKASENWVTKFIRRNGLTLKRSYVTYEQNQQPPASVSAAQLAHLGVDPATFSASMAAAIPESSAGGIGAGVGNTDAHGSGMDDAMAQHPDVSKACVLTLWLLSYRCDWQCD